MDSVANFTYILIFFRSKHEVLTLCTYNNKVPYVGLAPVMASVSPASIGPAP